MKKKTIPPRFVTNRPYKFDKSMELAAQRARAFAPVPISMVSNVPDYSNLSAERKAK